MRRTGDLDRGRFRAVSLRCCQRAEPAATRHACCPSRFSTPSETSVMLYTIAVVLIVLWALGFLAFHVGGGLIHLLLVIAVIVVLLRVIQGRRPV